MPHKALVMIARDGAYTEHSIRPDIQWSLQFGSLWPSSGWPALWGLSLLRSFTRPFPDFTSRVLLLVFQRRPHQSPLFLSLATSKLFILVRDGTMKQRTGVNEKSM